MDYNKASIEALPLSNYMIDIQSSYAVFGEEDAQHRLFKTVEEVVANVEEIGIGGSGICRLIIFTYDLQSQVAEWSKQLNEAWRVSSEGAIGQTLSWGDGEIESTYAIIILSQDIALSKNTKVS